MHNSVTYPGAQHSREHTRTCAVATLSHLREKYVYRAETQVLPSADLFKVREIYLLSAYNRSRYQQIIKIRKTGRCSGFSSLPLDLSHEANGSLSKILSFR